MWCSRNPFIMAKMAYYCYYSAASTYFPFLPLFYKQMMSLDPVSVGTLLALRPLMMLLAAPFWGGVADRYNRHRDILLLCLTLAALIRLFMAWATSFSSAFAVLVCSEFFGAGAPSIMDSIMLQMLGDARAEYGKYRLWGAVSWGTFAFVGGAISRSHGLQSLFIVYSILTIPTLITAAQLDPHRYRNSYKEFYDIDNVSNTSQQTTKDKNTKSIEYDHSSTHESGSQMVESNDPLYDSQGTAPQPIDDTMRQTKSEYIQQDPIKSNQPLNEHIRSNLIEATPNPEQWDDPATSQVEHKNRRKVDKRSANNSEDTHDDKNKPDVHNDRPQLTEDDSSQQKDGAVEIARDDAFGASSDQSDWVDIEFLTSASNSADEFGTIPEFDAQSNVPPTHISTNNSTVLDHDRQDHEEHNSDEDELFLDIDLESEFNDEEIHVSKSTEPVRASAESPMTVPTSMGAHLHILLLNPEVILFACIVLCSGLLMGIISNFLFLRLEELNGDSLIMGLSLTLTCVSEVPFFFFSGKVIDYFGHLGVMSFALICYGIRILYYSLLTNPWWVLPIELLHGITFGIGWSACVSFAHKVAPPGLEATTQGILSSIHWGVGNSGGAYFAGLLYSRIGLVQTFRWSLVLVGIGLIFVMLEKYRTNMRHTKNYERVPER